MNLDSIFKVDSIEQYPEVGRVVVLRTWPRGCRRCDLRNSDLDVEEGDIIHARIQNHDVDTGWKMEEMYGFHYTEQKPPCEVCLLP